MSRVRLTAEQLVQARLFSDLRAARVPLCWHTFNEGIATASYRRKQRTLGMLPGVVDIVCLTPPPLVPGAPGWVLEVKADKGKKPTPEEWAFLVDAARAGYAAGWAKGYDACRALLVGWGVLR